VFSNLRLHWYPAPHEDVREMARVLQSGGLVLFSSYGPAALSELGEACKRSLPSALLMPYMDMHGFGDMLVAAGFEAPVMEVDTVHWSFGGPRQLPDEVRGLCGNPHADWARGLPSGQQARTLLRALQDRADPQGRIRMRFEIVIRRGWKAAPRSPGVSAIRMPHARGA